MNRFFWEEYVNASEYKLRLYPSMQVIVYRKDAGGFRKYSWHIGLNVFISPKDYSEHPSKLTIGESYETRDEAMRTAESWLIGIRDSLGADISLSSERIVM